MSQDIKLDILAICAHPDDAELHCSGLLLKAKNNGASIGVLDLTRGEAASRGTPEIRAQEAKNATKLLGLSIRDNLNLPDSKLKVNEQTIKLIVEKIRHYQPKIVVTSHWDDHHPDHQATSLSTQKACYLAGIGNYDAKGTPHRPEQVMYYIDRLAHKPDLIQDISDVFAQKLEAVKCYASQLYTANSDETDTPLASASFIEQWRGRHLHYGSLIGVKYGEGYVLRSPVALDNPLDLVWGRKGQV